MNANEPQFWMMIASIVIAVCFIVMAIALGITAYYIKKVVATVNDVKDKIDPLIDKVTAISEQGKQMSVQFTEVSANLAVTSKYVSESMALVKDEVGELKQLVGMTAVEAKDKIALVSRTIDRTNMQVMTTTDFIQEKVVVPAREIAAIMAGVRKGLEVLFAPSPKQIDRAYADDEMFIG